MHYLPSTCQPITGEVTLSTCQPITGSSVLW